MTALPDVRPADVWKDSDPRGGPTFVVVQVCPSPLGSGCRTVVEGQERPHAHVTQPDGKRLRKILLARFVPSSRGYTLVERDGKAVDG